MHIACCRAHLFIKMFMLCTRLCPAIKQNSCDGTMCGIHPAKTQNLSTPIHRHLNVEVINLRVRENSWAMLAGIQRNRFGRWMKTDTVHQFGRVDSLVDNCRKSCNHYKDQLMLKRWEKCLSLCHIAHFPTSSSILDLFDMCGNG